MKVWGWLAFVVPFGIYAASLSPYVNVWDTAELQTVPYILGIAHPTGFPAFVLGGWLFSHALPFGTVAWRISLFCALAMSGTALTVFVLCRRLAIGAAASCGSAILFAVGTIAWTRGTRAEVHAFATLETVVAATAALVWYQTKQPRALVVAALALGVGLATHETVGLAVPGVAVLIVAARRVPSWRVVALCVACVTVPCASYAYIPLRSADVFAHHRDPTLALGVPPGRPFWDYGHPATPAAFLRYVTGSDFRAAATLAKILDPATYVAIGPDLWTVGTQEFPGPALALAAVGAAALLRRSPVTAVGLGVALCAAIPFAYAYTAESDPARYALPAFALVATLAGYGAELISGWLAHGDGRLRDATSALALAILVCAVLNRNWYLFGERTDSRWAHYVDRVRAATPGNAIIVADWAYATPLAYAAFVERSFGRRVVETSHPSDDVNRVRGWARTRPVYIVSESVPRMLADLRLTMASPGEPNILRVHESGR